MNTLHISSADEFQGREKDVIIVRNDRSNPRGNIGFKDDFNLLFIVFNEFKSSSPLYKIYPQFNYIEKNLKNNLYSKKIKCLYDNS